MTIAPGTSEAYAIGSKIVELCNQRKNLEAIDTYYHKDVVSVEVCDMPEIDMPAEMSGIDAIKGKNQWWIDNHEVHSNDCSGPFPHGDQFIILFRIDVTAKVGPMAGQRMQMEEAGLFTVADGKVVREQFFYNMEG